MKKKLLALAVLASTGVAWAQTATLSGTYAVGYQSGQTLVSGGKGIKNSGIGTDTAAISLVATEDLGGGLKVMAKVSLGGMMRDGAGTGEDALIVLSGGFGALVLGALELDDGLGRARAGGKGLIGLDGKVHGGNPRVDMLDYTAPALAPGLTAQLTYTDHGVGTVWTGLAQGTSGSSSFQPAWTPALNYKAGSVDARIDYTAWMRKDALDVTTFNKLKDRVRLSGSYDFGVAKVGLGFARKSFTAAAANQKITSFTAGLSAPVGPIVLSGVFESEKEAVGGLKRTGFNVAAQYDLSKRTNVSTSYAQWKDNAANTSSANSFRVLVSHNF